jgi:hypothetical protein
MISKRQLIQSFRNCIFILFTSVLNVNASNVLLNEIMSSNTTSIKDQFGKYEDWIELYNNSDEDINLSGYRISDDENNPARWIFPSVTIKSKGFLLIFASGKDIKTGNILHTNFSIKSAGEPIFLSDSNGVLIDKYNPVSLLPNNSFGRLTDGSEELVKFNGSTPGYSNNGQTILYQSTLVPEFSHEQGLYNEPFSLSVSYPEGPFTLHYTTDGRNPTANDPIYTDPISVEDRTSEPNKLSIIRTNATDSSRDDVFWHWKAPLKNVFKGQVFKFQLFENNLPYSPIITKTYLVNKNIHLKYKGLPVISIVTDSVNLFGYKEGIYVPGETHDLNPMWDTYWGNGNYSQRGVEWERPADMTFFEPDGSIAFQLPVGIRMQGLGSRALPQKTLRLYARNSGNTFDYGFFPESDFKGYKRILLRNSGQDFNETMFKDALSSVLVNGFNIEKQSYRPSIVFINGEYWGIHNIRDRIDKYFYEYAAGADPDNIDIIELKDDVSEGDIDDYNKLFDFIRNHDIAEHENYTKLSELMDIDNFLDYVIAKQFIVSWDWPGNNTKFWKNKEPGAKWRWTYFDNDYSFINSEYDMIKHSTLNDENVYYPNPEWSTFILRNLYLNAEFTQAYKNKFDQYLNNQLAGKNVIKTIDSLALNLKGVINEHINRWGYPYSYAEWNDKILSMKEFSKTRPCNMAKLIYSYFGYEQSKLEKICSIEKELEEIKVIAYPNPGSQQDQISVIIENYNPQNIKVSLINTLGQNIYSTELIHEVGKILSEISLPRVASGTYYIVVETKDNKQYKKIVIL